MIEEAIIFQVYPTFFASLGILGVFAGVIIMIFTKEYKNLRYEEPKADNFYVELNECELEQRK